MPLCPACGHDASGRYCAACGTPLAGVSCAECKAPLAPNARFCSQCGAAVGGGRNVAVVAVAAAATAPGSGGAPPKDSVLPWAIAGTALVALVGLVAIQGRDGGAPPVAAAPSALGGPAGSGARAPDISALSPRERADRLYDRVMRYAEQGQMDSLQFFAPMAMAALEMIQPADAHARYDLGRIAEVAGNEAVARAQADTILAAQPAHLLGLTLASTAARMRSDAEATRGFERRLLAAAPAERRRQVDEYQQHARDIDLALERARRQN